MLKKNPHYPDTTTGRTKLYSFNWVGGGYNQVFAKGKKDAKRIAEAWFNSNVDHDPLTVQLSSVMYQRNPTNYYNSLPLFD
jgi:hypothetical protein